MRADPEPEDIIVVPNSQRAVVAIDPDGPQVIFDQLESKRRTKELLEAWLISRARTRFGQGLESCHYKLGKLELPLPALRLRRMTKRWGSCTRKAIYLNRDLIKAPSHCIEYVVMHELCHLKYRGHDKRFWIC